MCRGKGEEGILMVFLIEWDIKIHAKRELYWIVDLMKKKIILAEALQDVEFSVSVYRPVALRPRSVVAQSCLDSGTCLRPCGRRIVHWVLLFVSLWYADKPDIKRGSHGDEKEPADTVQRWGGERRTINGIQACLDIYWLDCMRPSLRCTRN